MTGDLRLEERDLNYDTLREIAERFPYENFGDVRSVRIDHITTRWVGNEPAYRVLGRTGKGMPIEVMVAKDGRVVACRVGRKPFRPPPRHTYSSKGRGLRP